MHSGEIASWLKNIYTGTWPSAETGGLRIDALEKVLQSCTANEANEAAIRHQLSSRGQFAPTAGELAEHVREIRKQGQICTSPRSQRPVDPETAATWKHWEQLGKERRRHYFDVVINAFESQNRTVNCSGATKLGGGMWILLACPMLGAYLAAKAALDENAQ